MNSQTVCIIDDDKHVQYSISTLLQVVGYNAMAFESAEAFLEESSVDVSEFGCLILDVRLPGMSGLELLEELNNREINVPVVLVSGHANDEMLELGLAHGARTLFEKPFDARKLIEVVKNAVEERRN